MQRHLEFPLIIIIGFLLTFFLTWPLVTKIDSYYSDASDHSLVGWLLWYNQQSIVTGRILDQQAYFNSNQFYPFPFSLAYSEHLFVPSVIFALIYWLSNNLVFSVNFYTILTFVLTFLSSFYSLNFFIKDKQASLVGAFIFTFNPLTFAHAQGHLQLLNKFFLPPLFLFAYLFAKNPIWKNSFLFFSTLTLNALSSSYFQTFSIILIPIFWLPFIFARIIQKNIQFFFNFFLKSLVFLIFLPILLYFNLPYLQFSSSEVVHRTLKENSYFSARGIDWISSLETNLLYGQIVKELDFLRQPREGNGSLNYSEHTLFPNLLAIILFVVGLLTLGRRILFLPFVLVLLFSAAFTFGPYFHGWNQKESTSATFYDSLFNISVILQAIRVPTRFQFIFYLPFSLFVALGVKRLIKSGNYIYLFLGLIWLVLLLENININDFNSTSPTLDYISLKKTENSQLIGLLKGKNTIHFPLFVAGPARNVAYLNWSTKTEEKTFNGYSGFGPTDWTILAQQLKKLDKQQVEKIYLLGINYLIVHKDLIGLEDGEAYRNNKTFLQQGLVYSDQSVEVIDLAKFQFRSAVCPARDLKFDIKSASYPVAQISGTIFQLFSNITLINPKDCYIVSKYQDRYSQIKVIFKDHQEIIPIKLPILIEPFEKIKIT